jgi:hypothetical protein
MKSGQVMQLRRSVDRQPAHVRDLAVPPDWYRCIDTGVREPDSDRVEIDLS